MISEDMWRVVILLAVGLLFKVVGVCIIYPNYEKSNFSKFMGLFSFICGCILVLSSCVYYYRYVM